MIIGIGYKKQVGKDTFANIILDNFKDRKIVINNMADSLKEIIIKLFPCVEHRHLYGTDEDKNEVIPELNGDINTGRKIAQHFGTDCCRKIYTDVWVEQFIQRAKRQIGKIIICTDVRFPNEANHIKANGGILLRINRPSLPADDDHASENALNDYKLWDYNIDNDGSLEDLKSKAIDFFNNIISKRLEREINER